MHIKETGRDNAAHATSSSRYTVQSDDGGWPLLLHSIYPLFPFYFYSCFILPLFSSPFCHLISTAQSLASPFLSCNHHRMHHGVGFTYLPFEFLGVSQNGRVRWRSMARISHIPDYLPTRYLG
ncbi:hypothetical protein N656DRAFT_344464 [Canariomyces notabilis]|uniref:Uncharacterized protein n=1 Tax=Canariomyces notabilis TaxID=2074819 RepID=A0AAN6T9Q2_9PEZI|nr:hypothetical protein N656DRAFT_344464 [Canariomyces arenarius]